MTSRSSSAVIVGAVLVTFGLIQLGAQFGWWLTQDPRPWWPFFPIMFGIGQILAGRNGYMLVAIGAIFLLDTMGHLPFRETWPMLLVLWGVAVIVRPYRRQRRLGHD